LSKTKLKGKSELEHLRGQNKKLTSENKQLRKRLKAIVNKSHFYEHIADEVIEDIDVKESCEFCGKGELYEIDLKFLKIKKCNVCDFSERIKV
jgi:hypothetical protein